MTTDKGPTKLTLIDVKQIYDCVVSARCHPWILFSEVHIVYWKEVVFELVDNLKIWLFS